MIRGSLILCSRQCLFRVRTDRTLTSLSPFLRCLLIVYLNVLLPRNLYTHCIRTFRYA
jgi:hypothetical protein